MSSLFVLLGIVVFLSYFAIKYLAVPIGISLLFGGGIFLLYQIYLSIYFSGGKFKIVKDSIESYIKNCNELNMHIEELKKY
jgi:hypothetical protein